MMVQAIRHAQLTLLASVFLFAGLEANAVEMPDVRVVSTPNGKARVLDSPMPVQALSQHLSYQVVNRGGASERKLQEPMTGASKMILPSTAASKIESGPDGQLVRVLSETRSQASESDDKFPVVDLIDGEPLPVADFRPDVRYRRVPE